MPAINTTPALACKVNNHECFRSDFSPPECLNRPVFALPQSASPTKIDTVKVKIVCFGAALTIAPIAMDAQPTPAPQPDRTNKALITKVSREEVMAAAALHTLADNYYAWRNEDYPVRSSDTGLHTWDNRLTDYSPTKIAERAQHVRALLEKVRAMKIGNWPKDDQIDAILFRAQLENVDFRNRILKFERTNPDLYVGECTSAIFSLLKKEYDTPHNRALAATARLKAMPALLKQGLTNLQNPVKTYARFAIESARAIDPLLNNSLMTLDAGLAPGEHDQLVKARDGALVALHAYADELEKRLPKMAEFAPMGQANYNYYLKHVLLLPLNAAEVEMIGRVELAHYRALEAWLADPKLADKILKDMVTLSAPFGTKIEMRDSVGIVSPVVASTASANRAAQK